MAGLKAEDDLASEWERSLLAPGAAGENVDGEAGAQVYAFDVGEPERVESFPHRFVRIHRATIVNTAFVQELFPLLGPHLPS